MGLLVEKRRYTIAEYLASEEMAEEKHEFHDGEILAMSGGTRDHAVISGNLYSALDKRMTGHPCQPFNDQLRVRIPGSARYLYPDVSVVCGEIHADPEDPKCSITNPRLLIEVLSSSTESYDRGEKFNLYRRLPSLQEYVLVSQTRPQVEVFHRQDDNSWRFVVASGMDATLTLASIQLEIPFSEIYARLTFAPQS